MIGHSDEVIDLAFITDSHVAMATNSADLKVMSLATGDIQLLSGHRDIVVCLSVGENGLVASGDKVS